MVSEENLNLLKAPKNELPEVSEEELFNLAIEQDQYDQENNDYLDEKSIKRPRRTKRQQQNDTQNQVKAVVEFYGLQDKMGIIKFKLTR